MARTSFKESKPKVVKSIPSSDTGSRVACYTKEGETGDKYIISHNPLKMQFTLWKRVEEGYEKVSTSDSPLRLYELVGFEKIG